jgi:hypothetical protein
MVHLSIYRARTTSFFVQLCTCRQCGQVILWFLTLAAAHNSSLMVCPVGVSFAVDGHRTRRRLMIGPVFSFRTVVVIKNFIIF